jgi:hypothetical protein
LWAGTPQTVLQPGCALNEDGFRFLAKTMTFFSFENVQPSIQWLPRAKWTGLEADGPSARSTAVKNQWSCNFTQRVCLRGVDRDNCTLSSLHFLFLLNLLSVYQFLFKLSTAYWMRFVTFLQSTDVSNRNLLQLRPSNGTKINSISCNNAKKSFGLQSTQLTSIVRHVQTFHVTWHPPVLPYRKAVACRESTDHRTVALTRPTSHQLRSRTKEACKSCTSWRHTHILQHGVLCFQNGIHEQIQFRLRLQKKHVLINTSAVEAFGESHLPDYTESDANRSDSLEHKDVDRRTENGRVST